MKINYKKYRYLGKVSPEVPKTWEYIILEMLISIDKLVKPKYYPRFILNFIADKGEYIFDRRVYISQIKQKFGSLRVYGSFSEDIQKIITKAEKSCNMTCEFCGNQGTNMIMIKNWVRNICTTCEEVKKNGSNI